MVFERTPLAGVAPAAATPATDAAPAGGPAFLRGLDYAAATAALAPGATPGAAPAADASSGPRLTSPRFLAVPDLLAVMRGERLLRWGNANGPPTFALQGALAALGHDPGPVDGMWGPRTQAAVLGFQRAAGLGADGLVGPLTLGALDRQDPGGMGPGGGAGGSGVGQGTADPRLEHQLQQNAAGQYVDPEAPGPTTRLPYVGRDAGSGWDGEAILRRWTQLDLDPLTATDAHRCAANAALAPRILAGPAAVHTYALAIMEKAKQQIASPHVAATRKALVGAKLAFLGLADAAVTLASATYHSLDLLADAVKTIMTRDPGGATSGIEGATLHAEAADDKEMPNAVPGSIADVDFWCDRLAPGEAWLVQVDTDVKAQGTAATQAQLDHFVTIGCLGDKPPSEGGVYLYDPWPRRGSQMIFRTANRGDFLDYFLAADGSMKYAEFLNRTDPRA